MEKRFFRTTSLTRIDFSRKYFSDKFKQVFQTEQATLSLLVDR